MDTWITTARAPRVELKPLDSPELLQLVAAWLGRKENYQWLDFGNGRQIVTAEWLKIMAQRDTHVLRVYTADDGRPLGVMGLDDIHRSFRTARIWAVAGEEAFRRHGYATRAVSKMLTLAFRDLGLETITTWVVETNPSIHIAERLNFQFIGRQRQCHYIDGRPYDRLWFDLLASEHREL